MHLKLNETTKSGDLITEFSFDEPGPVNDHTSTPRMRSDNSNTNFYSDVSSPESFYGPEFSPLL